jgi:N-acetylneuraminic acid mutarotase
MPTIRQGLCAAAVEGIIYAIGGCEVEPGVDRDISTVEAYDPAKDTWTRKADMPTARALSAIAVVDGIIYVIGGAFDDNYLDGVNVDILSTVEAYDPATDTWTRKADMPTARYRFDACVIDGQIYVSGGATTWGEGTGNWTGVSNVEVYNPITDTWTQVSSMPRTWHSHTASGIDGMMYIIGGLDHESLKQFKEGKITEDEMVETLRVIYVYDPATDTWATSADRLPTPRSCLTAVVVDGKIYAIGGMQDDATPKLRTVEEFDPSPPDSVSSVSPGGKLLETWGRIRKR